MIEEPEPEDDASYTPAVVGSSDASAFTQVGWRLAVLGDIHVDGASIGGDQLKVGSALGSVHIDLTGVDIPQDGIGIKLMILAGSARIVVPDGTEVQSSAVALAGNSTAKLTAPSPTGGQVRLTGFVGLGNVEIYAASNRPLGVRERLRRRRSARGSLEA